MNDPRTERLAAYLDGELNEISAAQLRRDLEADPGFAREAARVAVIDRLLRLRLSGATGNEFAREATARAGMTAAAAPFVEQVMQSVRTDESASRIGRNSCAGWRKKSWWKIAAFSGIAASLLLAVSWIVVSTWKQRSAARFAIAAVERLSGKVMIHRGSQTLVGAEGTPLNNGDTLSVSTPGYLVLKYDPQRGLTEAATRLLGASGTKFRMWTEEGAPRVEVLWGSLSADVAPRPPNSTLKFLSRFATAEVLGTRFKMCVDDWRTRLEVTEGTVCFQNTGGGAAQIIAAGGKASAMSREPLPELACHLTFDGDEHDSSPAKVPMAWVGPSAFTTGRLGQAAVFNGLDGRTHGNRVVAQPHPSLYGMRQITVALWVKRNNSAASSHLLSNHLRYQFVLSRDTFQYSLFLGKPEYNQDAGSCHEKVVVKSLDDTDWHHLAMTYDGNILRGYVDGRLVHSHPLVTAEIAEYTEYDLNVGGTSSDNVLDGMLDDLRIYRRALTAEEIIRLSQAQEP